MKPHHQPIRLFQACPTILARAFAVLGMVPRNHNARPKVLPLPEGEGRGEGERDIGRIGALSPPKSSNSRFSHARPTLIAAACAVFGMAFHSGWVARAAQASPPASSSKISYNRDIRPVLSDNCFFCHGPDQKKRKAKLRLDIREEALAKNAFVPGAPDKSELIRRVFTTDTDDLMPPPASHKTLTLAQKQLFRRWIAQGAEYQKHWAYLPPVRPSVPSNRDAIDFL